MSDIPLINARVKQVVDEFCGGVVQTLAAEIGVSQQKLNRLFLVDKKSGKYPSMPVDILVGITKKFVDVDPAWLLTGKGEIRLKEKSAQPASNNEAIMILREMLKEKDEENKKLIKESGKLTKEIESLKGIIEALKKEFPEVHVRMHKYELKGND